MLGETIETLAAVVETKDPHASGHQRRVVQFAAAIAAELGLAQGRIRGLPVAGLLHDIGKVYVPAEILSGPGGGATARSTCCTAILGSATSC